MVDVEVKIKKLLTRHKEHEFADRMTQTDSNKTSYLLKAIDIFKWKQIRNEHLDSAC